MNREQPVSLWVDSRRCRTRVPLPAHSYWACYTWNSLKNPYLWKHCCKDRRAYKVHKGYRVHKGCKASSAGSHNAKEHLDLLSDNGAGYNRH